MTAIYGKFSSPVYLTNTVFRNFDYFVRAFHPSIYPPPTHSSIHPFFVRPSVHPFICSFVLSLFSPSVRTSYCSFFSPCSFVRSILDLFIYLFIYLFFSSCFPPYIYEQKIASTVTIRDVNSAGLNVRYTAVCP